TSSAWWRTMASRAWKTRGALESREAPSPEDSNSRRKRPAFAPRIGRQKPGFDRRTICAPPGVAQPAWRPTPLGPLAFSLYMYLSIYTLVLIYPSIYRLRLLLLCIFSP